MLVKRNRDFWQTKDEGGFAGAANQLFIFIIGREFLNGTVYNSHN
jgi:hypothetical protein